VGDRMNTKKWNIVVLTGTMLILGVLAAVTLVIDPFLHYHKPLACLEYPLKDERYINDGIARWYDYDAIITGTSMTQNFKVSELNSLMGVNAIKTSFSGASFHELNENISRALSYQPDMKMVLCSMDGSRIRYPADKDEYTNYPEYLYNDNPFDDVNYLLNKEVIPKTLAVINYTRAGEITPTMDDYGNWSRYKIFGKEEVKKTMSEPPVNAETVVLSEEDIQMAYENVEKNFLNMARMYPDTQFYFFFPPYSIAYWQTLHQKKKLDAQLELEKMAVEIMLQADNVHIFGFADWIDVISDLDNYMDTIHYSEKINSKILEAIAQGEGELTEENYEMYFEKLKRLYSNYDYDSVWN